MTTERLAIVPLHPLTRKEIQELRKALHHLTMALPKDSKWQWVNQDDH
jgi:hypothetical protein